MQLQKAGLKYSAICKHCSGHACEHSPETELNENDTEDEDIPIIDQTFAQEDEGIEDFSY